MCVHVNIFVHINEHIKLYEEYIIVNNGSLANEDNDHGGGEKKKSKLVHVITMCIIFSHLSGRYDDLVMENVHGDPQIGRMLVDFYILLTMLSIILIIIIITCEDGTN